MGVKGIFKFIFQRTLEFTVIILLITFLPNLPPHASYSDRFKVSPPKPLEGKLALNRLLEDVEIWHKGDLVGAEAFAVYNGEVYTSLHGGDIVKLVGNHITPVVKLGKPCKAYYEEKICGRPLGIVFDKNGNLYAADAYYGIFKINVKTGEKMRLVSPNDEIGGKKTKLFNSLAVASNGDIYWSASSTQFLLEDGLFDLLADPSGRLVHYDAKTKKNKVLIDDVAFANGVVLSEDESFVLLTESARSRIYKYHLRGPKNGQAEVLVDGLPGIPDNITPDGQGGFIVSLYSAVDAEHPSIFQILYPFPFIRKFISRIIALPQLLFDTVNRIYPNEISQRAVHWIGHFTSVNSFLVPKRQTIILISANGEILSSIHSLNGKLAFISEGHIVKDQLYLGSPHNDYIGRIPLSKIGWDHLSHERTKRDIPVKIEEKPQAKPTVAPKQQPTTTTPKPQTSQVPKQTTAAPVKNETPKRQDTTTAPPPKQQTTQPPKQQVTQPPKQQATQPPKQQTTQPPKQQTTQPPKQETAPLKKETAVPKKETAVPKKETAAPKKETAPPKPKQEKTAPPQQQTTQPPPPKKETVPPKKEQTPAAKQQTTTPPPKQQTPPKQAPPQQKEQNVTPKPK